MFMNVAISGYYGTGSSAVIDLLKEYSDCNIAAPVDTEYEHVPFYYPGGLFDMYAILSSPYLSAYNSDIAINRFIKAAQILNDNNFGWIGSYKKYYGHEYMEIVESLVEKISRKTGRQSSAHMKKVRFSFIKAILQIGAKIAIKRPITKVGRYYVTDNMPGYYAMPSLEDLNIACKEYIQAYLKMCMKDCKVNVFDHLIWPQQCQLIDTLFPNNFRAIVVKRDPRDVYWLNKYYWHKPPVSISKPYFPTEVTNFCKEWKEQIINQFKSNKVLAISFEDLIYNYDKTVAQIEDFLGLKNTCHKSKKMYFNPDMSIENTQVYTINKDWREETKRIELELQDYLYSFPRERMPNKNLWFDTEAQQKRLKK